MESLAPVAEGIASNPLAWGIVLCLAALAYLYKESRANEKEFFSKILEIQQKAESEQRELLMKIIPLIEKTTDGIEALERLQDRIERTRP